MPRNRLNKEVLTAGESSTQHLSAREDKEDVMEEVEADQLNDQCASKTLLALRKSSIGNLLN